MQILSCMYLHPGEKVEQSDVYVVVLIFSVFEALHWVQLEVLLIDRQLGVVEQVYRLVDTSRTSDYPVSQAEHPSMVSFVVQAQLLPTIIKIQ